MPAKPKPAKTPAHVLPLERLSDFLRVEENMAFLRALAREPKFIALCRYAEESTRVTPGDLSGPQALLSEEIVRKASLNAGAALLPRYLNHLIATSAKKDAALPEDPWGHILPPEN
jgi:hypothetical protein